VPALRYRDVAAAIDWLSAAFGFERHRIVTGEDGSIVYGLLTFGDHLIMVWPVRESDLDRLMKQPDEIGGVETQTCYLVVEDADAHYANATAANAGIVIPIQDHDDLGRGYSCRDPEGHIWHFGTYDPWRGKPSGQRFQMSRNLRSSALLGGMLVTVIAVGGAGWMLGHAPSQEEAGGRAAEAIAAASRRADEIAKHAQVLASERAQASVAKDTAERAAEGAREQLGRERTAREIVERSARRWEEQAEQERRRKDAAVERANGAVEQMAKDRTAMEAARRAIEETKRELAREREARQQAERSLQDVLARSALESDAKEVAERPVGEAKERQADVQGEIKSAAEPPRQEKHSKEIAERRPSTGADLSEAMRNRRICGDILSDPSGYDRTLVELCLKISRR
jgi:uncharacterized glyoxalase superfamily protein PhnB